MANKRNKIQDKMFKDFEIQLWAFYRKRQQQYFEELKEKIEDGGIDVQDPSYREQAWKEAERFMATRPKELLKFIRNYVDEGIDRIKNDLSNKTITKEEADIKFEVLKHILLAGEEESEKPK